MATAKQLRPRSLPPMKFRMAMTPDGVPAMVMEIKLPNGKTMRIARDEHGRSISSNNLRSVPEHVGKFGHRLKKFAKKIKKGFKKAGKFVVKAAHKITSIPAVQAALNTFGGAGTAIAVGTGVLSKVIDKRSKAQGGSMPALQSLLNLKAKNHPVLNWALQATKGLIGPVKIRKKKDKRAASPTLYQEKEIVINGRVVWRAP